MLSGRMTLCVCINTHTDANQALSQECSGLALGYMHTLKYRESLNSKHPLA